MKTKHLIVLEVDLGLNKIDTLFAIRDIIESGTLNVDRDYMKNEYPGIQKGSIICAKVGLLRFWRFLFGFWRD